MSLDGIETFHNNISSFRFRDCDIRRQSIEILTKPPTCDGHDETPNFTLTVEIVMRHGLNMHH